MTAAALRAPRLTWLRVEGVHLYNDGGEVEVDLDRPISSFVGANGIGKSTLLALANFAMTGLVPDDTATFQSVEEFFDATGSFAAEYFDGRVDESYRRTTSVTARFELGDSTIEVQRGLFDGGTVRAYRVASSQATEPSRSIDAASGSDLTESYRRTVVAASNLASYEQFCFWQLFMMTFDERRHLLFWDERTLQSALMIALGHSPQDAVVAEKLSRDIERQESLARNARWRATQATGKRSRLVQDSAADQQLTEEQLLALRDRSEALIEAEAKRRDRFDADEVELQDASRTLAELAIEESNLEALYLEQFAATGSHRSPLDHPVFRSVLSDGECDVCGTHTRSLSPQVSETVNAGHCPICASPVNHLEDSVDGSELLRLDSELARARKRVEDARQRIRRIRDSSAEHALAWRESSDELASFMSANSANLKPANGTAVAAEIRRYDQEIAEAMRETAEYRRKRDESRASLEPIIEGLASAYAQIETVFVPTFQRLAEQFIGRSVDVEFERRGVSVRLRFGLDGQTRRSATELSESQQFFLDIALRMSIIETFVEKSSTLLVDTPEGSLDIAYETRAGKLFGQFVRGGNSLVLMNNLNSSNLLKQLTSLATPDEMSLFKMIEWSRLSDVQIESASLFDDVFFELSASLNDVEKS